MRKAFFVILMLLATLPAVAGEEYASSSVSASESGWGVFLSAGSERREVSGKVVFMDDQGEVLEPRSGVLRIEEGRALVAAALIKGADNKSDYGLEWTNLALVSKDNLQTASFDPAHGWGFAYQPCKGITPLNLVLVNKKGKADYIRLFFKITYDRDPVRAYDQLFVQTVPQGTLHKMAGAGGKDYDPAIKALEAGNLALKQSVDQLIDWKNQMIAQNGTEAKTTGKKNTRRKRILSVPFVVSGCGDLAVAVFITDSKGTTVCEKHLEGGFSVDLLYGSYTIAVEVPGYGRRSSELVVKAGLELPCKLVLHLGEEE